MSQFRFPWLRTRKKSDPDWPEEPPIWLGNHSNGEYFHTQTRHEARCRRVILDKAADYSRKLGVSRREFLSSSAGMALSVGVINWLSGCGSSSGPPSLDDCMNQGETPIDTSKTFIFDIQTHHFDKDGFWRETNPGYDEFLTLIGNSTARCDSQYRDPTNDYVDCLSRERYAETLFLDSDTTMAVLSSWPAMPCTDDRRRGCGLPLPNEQIAATRDWFNDLTMSRRLVNHCQVMPNVQPTERQLATMEEVQQEFGVAAWKAYTAWGPDEQPGFWMDDEVGRAFIEKGIELGVPLFCIHKGLPIPGFDLEHNFPRDIGVVASDYPEANFIVYHSSICAGSEATFGCTPNEGPYDPDNAMGTDALIKSLEDNDIEPNSNVYAELGSAWSNVMTNTTLASHLIGKLMKHVGEDRVVWGTDSLAAAPPQQQIAAFQAFEIPEDMQEMYGYPALTPERKAKIFGLNAAKVYGVDPEAQRCQVEQDELAALRRELDSTLGDRRWTVKPPHGPTTRREFMKFYRKETEEVRQAVYRRRG